MECDQEIIPSGGQSLRHVERQPSTALVGPDDGVTRLRLRLRRGKPRHRGTEALYGSGASRGFTADVTRESCSSLVRLLDPPIQFVPTFVRPARIDARSTS